MALPLALVWLSGCVTLGPKVRTDIVFVKHQGVAARVAESVKVKLIVEKGGQAHTQEMDIGGFYVISPDLEGETRP